jgi:septal ring factor EnvC (AmiA/AmiB activator)
MDTNASTNLETEIDALLAEVSNASMEVDLLNTSLAELESEANALDAELTTVERDTNEFIDAQGADWDQLIAEMKQEQAAEEAEPEL